MQKGKLLVLIILLTLFISLSAISAPIIDTASIVAIWLFDEGKGDTVSDASGNGHDGKFVGDIKWTDGKYKKALEFAGVATSRVEVPDHPSLTLMTWTITAWAKLKQPPGGDWAVILLKDPGDGLQNYAMDIDKQGKIWAETTSGGKWAKSCNSTTNVYDDAWHFFTSLYDGKALKVYVDGKKENELVYGKPDTNDAPISMGSRRINTQPLNGIIDSIGLFNVALNDDQIKSIMDNGIDRATGIAPVEPKSKITATWGYIKSK